MKKQFLLLLAMLLLVFPYAFAQEEAESEAPKPAKKDDFYISSGGEMIFSLPDLDVSGSEEGAILRFSAVLNLEAFANYNPHQNIGMFGGLSLRNVGFIYDEPGTDIRKKYRTYNLGIPVGLKLGKMNGAFIYGGYEIEFPFNYKEKTFVDGDKEDKFNVWFSDRVPTYYQAFFAGIQLPWAVNLRFKYYLTGFFNQDFSETIDGVEDGLMKTSRPTYSTFPSPLTPSRKRGLTGIKKGWCLSLHQVHKKKKGRRRRPFFLL